MERRVFSNEKMADLFNIFNNEKISYSEFKSIVSSSYTIYDLFETNNRDKNISLSLPLLALYCKSKNAIKFCIESTPDVFTQFAQSSINGRFFSLSDTFHYEASVNFINQVMENFGCQYKDNLIAIYHHEPLFFIDTLYHYLDAGRYKKPDYDFKQVSMEHVEEAILYIIDNHNLFVGENENFLPKDIFYLYCQTSGDIISNNLMALCGINKEDMHTDPNIIFSLFSNNHTGYIKKHLTKVDIPFSDSEDKCINESSDNNVGDFLKRIDVDIITFIQHFYSNVFDKKRRKDFILRNDYDFYLSAMRKHILKNKKFEGFYEQYHNITHHSLDINKVIDPNSIHDSYIYANNLEEMLNTNKQTLTQFSDISKFLFIIVKAKDQDLLKRIFDNKYLGLYYEKKEMVNYFIHDLCKKGNLEEITEFIDIALEFKSNILGFKEPIKLPNVSKTTPGYRYLEKLKIMEDISQNKTSEDFQNKKRL